MLTLMAIRSLLPALQVWGGWLSESSVWGSIYSQPIPRSVTRSPHSVSDTPCMIGAQDRPPLPLGWKLNEATKNKTWMYVQLRLHRLEATGLDRQRTEDIPLAQFHLDAENQVLPGPWIQLKSIEVPLTALEPKESQAERNAWAELALVTMVI